MAGCDLHRISSKPEMMVVAAKSTLFTQMRQSFQNPALHVFHPQDVGDLPVESRKDDAGLSYIANVTETDT